MLYAIWCWPSSLCKEHQFAARWLQHGTDAVLYTVQRMYVQLPKPWRATQIAPNSYTQAIHSKAAWQWKWHKTQQPCSYHLSTALRRGPVKSDCLVLLCRHGKGQSLVNSVEKEIQVSWCIFLSTAQRCLPSDCYIHRYIQVQNGTSRINRYLVSWTWPWFSELIACRPDCHRLSLQKNNKRLSEKHTPHPEKIS